MFDQNISLSNLSTFGNEVDDLSNEPSQSLDSESNFRHPKLEEMNDLPSSTSSVSPLSKKRRPVATEVVRQRIESGQWHRKQMIGSSLRFQFFDELMEGDKSLELIICRLCDSAYSIHSRSHCLEHIKQRHPEVITESLVNSKLDDERIINDKNNFDGNPNNNAIIMGEANHSQNNSPLLGMDQRWSNLTTGGALKEELYNKDIFNSQPNPVATPLIKRRRLITTEMAKCRLQSGEWQLRSVAGASVRCRFFYEIYEGDSPLNTLSCKLCGATYSTQSRSHYREHVRRRHSEVYCVRSGRVSNNTVFDNSNLNESVHSLGPPQLRAAIDGGENEEEDFSTQFQNLSGMTDFMGADNNSMLTDDSVGGLLNSLTTVTSGATNNSSALKMRRIITTETVINHLEAGDWSRKSIPGMSIRSRFFDEIVDGDISLNILICKLCGSTYSSQSRSHCVEHVKKRHLSILEGNEEAEDFEIEAWKETRKSMNSSALQILQSQMQQQEQQGSQNKIPFNKNKAQQSSQASQSQLNKANNLSSQRRRKPFIPIAGPDQTIETPSIDSILQSLASHALFQDDGHNGGTEDDYMDPDDYKFDLSAINNIINGGATNSSVLNRKRTRLEENSSEVAEKRKNLDEAIADSPATRSESVSPVHTGGINDRLFAMSNLVACSSDKRNENEYENEMESANSHSSLFNSVNKNYDAENDNDRPPSNGSDPNFKSNMRIIRPIYHQQNNRNDLNRPMSPASNISNNRKQLNHQQLLMAARTAALLSGNSSDANVSPKGENNGFSRGNIASYNFPNRNSLSRSNISSGNMYQSPIQRQKYEYSQQQFLELQHRQKIQQQQRTQIFAHRNANGRKVPNRLVGSTACGAVPAGLLPPSFLNSQVSTKSSFSNGSSTNHQNSSVQSSAAENDSFCKNCKSEFPNVLKVLNQLYNRVNDFINVMHLALGSLHATEPHNKNVAEALKKLEESAASGAIAVNSFAASSTARKALAEAALESISDDAPILEANGFEDNDDGEFADCNEGDYESGLNANPEIELIEDTDNDNNDVCDNNNDCRSDKDNESGEFENITSSFINSEPLYSEEKENGEINQNNDMEEKNDRPTAVVNFGGSFSKSIDLATATDDKTKQKVCSAQEIADQENETPTPSSVISLDEDDAQNEEKKCDQERSSVVSDASSNIRDVYLSFLEKEILKVTPEKFDLDTLNNLSTLVHKSKPNKVTSALERLTLRGLLEVQSADNKGHKTYKKNLERIDQLSLELV